MYLLEFLATLASLLTVSSGAAIDQRPLGPIRQSQPFDTLDALDRLRQSVSGRLTKVEPIAKLCYSPGSFTSPDCVAIRGSKTNDSWLSHQPGGYYYSNWASCQATAQTCSLPLDNTTVVAPEAQCHQGSVPALAVDVQDILTLVSDIQAVFDFARSTGKPLVIKNTGHNIVGRSNAPDGIALWTHRLQDPAVPIVLDRHFVPDGCSDHPQEAVFHFGPGQQWGGAFKIAEASNFSLLGGTCPSVGIAGWLQGGGHSPLAPVYGMGVDNVRQLEIVTPHRGKITANECQNTDLFFATRGGGGGTWGVITNITYKAIPKLEMVDFHFNFTGASAHSQRFFDILTSHAVAWSKRGWGAYLKLGVKEHVCQFVNPKISIPEAVADMKELTEFLTAEGFTYSFQLQNSWHDYIEQVMSPHVGFWSMNFASRLLPTEAFSPSNRTRLVDALTKLVYEDELGVWLMMVAPTSFNHTTTSALHPSWKEAVMSIRVNSVWDQFNDIGSPSRARRHFESVHGGFEVIRNLAPTMGTSINEADIWEQDHERHYWGDENHKRLLRIKNDVDPENLLTNYGAVNWNANDLRYRCYPKP